MLQKDNLTKDEQDWIKEYENTDEYEQIYGEDKEVIDVYSETGDDVIRFQYFDDLDELHQMLPYLKTEQILKFNMQQLQELQKLYLAKA